LYTWRIFVLDIESTADEIGLHSEVAVAMHASRIVGLGGCGTSKAECFLSIVTGSLVWASYVFVPVMTIFNSVQNGPSLREDLMCWEYIFQNDHNCVLVLCLCTYQQKSLGRIGIRKCRCTLHVFPLVLRNFLDDKTVVM
jgi:hypothetical protein